jgi:hypothetical protein
VRPGGNWKSVSIGAACAAHPQERAIDTCQRCGAFVCGGCQELRQGESYCESCHHRQFGGKASTRAITALVLAILGLNCGPFLGIPAVILGTQELAAIDRGEAPHKGRPLAKGAQILGWIEIALTVVLAIVVLGLVVNRW